MSAERTSKSPYEILGISPDATADEIKSAYRHLSRRLHPDQGGSPALFDQLTEAYESVRDPHIQRDIRARDFSREDVASSPPAPKTPPQEHLLEEFRKWTEQRNAEGTTSKARDRQQADARKKGPAKARVANGTRRASVRLRIGKGALSQMWASSKQDTVPVLSDFARGNPTLLVAGFGVILAIVDYVLRSNSPEFKWGFWWLGLSAVAAVIITLTAARWTRGLPPWGRVVIGAISVGTLFLLQWVIFVAAIMFVAWVIRFFFLISIDGWRGLGKYLRDW